ncbi:CPBP family glutamic-type intramembrane protease [Haloferax mediterranei]|uniref:CPBP family glutamic-type intramembrane protease n=1 Tax=Haloferax mediterranei TaxID=2252 RepID=UPI001E574509|nr:CPBP family glutamic-type intramembrane protease [Haloferax mediterranei]
MGWTSASLRGRSSGPSSSVDSTCFPHSSKNSSSADSFRDGSATVFTQSRRSSWGRGLFALVHGLYGIAGGPEFLATYLIHLFGQGLVFCLVYERTDNLLIVALVHAISWTNSGFPFFGLL